MALTLPALSVPNLMTTATEAADLARHYEPLALAMVRKAAGAYPWLADDFESDARLALWKAAEDFDPAAGVPFLGYARMLIRFAILTRLRTERRTNQSAFRRAGAVALDGAEVEAVETLADDMRPVGADLEAAEVAKLLDLVPADRRRDLVRHVIDGETLTALGAERGVSRDAMRNRLGRELAKLRAAAGG